MVDMTKNYGSAFYSCAAGMGVGALFLGLVCPAKTGLWLRRKRTIEGGKPQRGFLQGRNDTPVDYVEVDLDIENCPANSKPWPV